MPIHNRKYLKPRRKVLRNSSIPAESFLWNYLNHSQLEKRKFRRQHSIENYIVDFYCPSENLVIELDGAVHENHLQIEADIKREKKLRELGFKILRFENQFVFDHLALVLDMIRAEFKS